MRTRTRGMVVTTAALACFGATTVGAYAYWSATATATVSITTSALPAAPTGLKCTASGSKRTLSWTAVAGVTQYRVYRAPNTLVATVNATSKPVTQAQMGSPTPPDGRYDVQVTSVTSDGESAASTSIKISFAGTTC